MTAEQKMRKAARLWCFITMILLLLLAYERKGIDERKALIAEIEKQQAIENIVPDPINRVPEILASKPSDYVAPVYEWQTKPQQICYPEVWERQAKEQARREAYKLEQWRAYRQEGITLYD